MPMMLALLLQAIPEAPRITSAPPIAVSAVSRPYSIPRERFVVDLEISGGDEKLWTGPLRVANGQTTSIRRERSEPVATPCPEDTYGAPAEQTALSVQLSPEQRGEGASAIRITVRWTRPGPASCLSRSSGRVVELNETVLLTRGQWVSVSGDAGLVLRLRRQ